MQMPGSNFVAAVERMSRALEQLASSPSAIAVLQEVVHCAAASVGLERAAVATARKSFDFEKSLAELEALVARMEDGKGSLEESLRDFEQGVKLTQQCQNALNEAQQRVQVLMQQDGEDRSVPFVAPEAGDAP